MSTFSSELKNAILDGMDIYEIRKRNLVQLIGKQRKNSCAERWGMNPAHLSQILSDKTAKNLGDDVARRIESIEGLQLGWFDSQRFTDPLPYAVRDTPDKYEVTRSTSDYPPDLVAHMLAKHGKDLSGEIRQKIAQVIRDTVDEISSTKIRPDVSSLAAREDEIVIRQYHVRALDHGQVPNDYNDVIRNLVIREDVLREKGVTYTSPHSLAMITGWGQSMEDTINDKDPLIVDQGIREYVGDGIYILTWHKHMFIKRIQMLDSERFLLVSDNPNIRDQEVHIEDIAIHAKVLLIWNARKA